MIKYLLQLELQRTCSTDMSHCHKNVPNIVSHSLTLLGAIIFMHFDQLCKFKHVLIFGGDACESSWLKTVFVFLLLPVGECIDAYVTIGSYLLCVSTH